MAKLLFLQLLVTFSICKAVINQDLTQGTQYASLEIDNTYKLSFDTHDRHKRQADNSINETLSNNETNIESNDTNTTVAPPVTTFTPSTTTSNWTIINDHHVYYTSKINDGREINANSLYKDAGFYNAVRHASLSENHRTASTVQLSFEFPFYGHFVKQITVATGGFMYMSEFLHQWLTATQYIAPLMGNFDTKVGNDSDIYYVDTGEEFVVWWDNIHLQDEPEVGPFSFQAHLYNTGQIHFAYKKVPKSAHLISTANHPVKVGLSDAYYYDTVLQENMKRRTIYEYHRVEIEVDKVTSNGSIIITPVPTCNMINNCNDCISGVIDFNCNWCTSLTSMRCSDGIDRHRQEWIKASCHDQALLTADSCPVPGNGSDSLVTSSVIPIASLVTSPVILIASLVTSSVAPIHSLVTSSVAPIASLVTSSVSPIKSGTGIGADAGVLAIVIIVVLMIVIAIGAVTGWFIYAYKNPNSDSGRWLIEHRPSQIRESLGAVTFWKKENSGDKYGVSVGGGETFA